MNEELNKKLAEWAGVKPHPVYPTGYDYPYFTDSLDACFKWLVPKLESYELKLNYKKHCAWVKLPTKYTEFGMAETPALALCLAIEKLIDKEARCL